MKLRRFSKEELARYDGSDNRPAYIAYKAKIYDISKSFLWQKGRHQALHVAGCDLTSDLAQAPHDEDLLEKFPVVGTLADD
jgi:predicted heme/steroid binding protein